MMYDIDFAPLYFHQEKFCFFSVKLRLMSNQSKPRIFNDQTKLFHQNATLILQGFKPTQIYRFYCVRESDGRLYSRSVDVTGAKGIEKESKRSRAIASFLV